MKEGGTKGKDPNEALSAFSCVKVSSVPQPAVVFSPTTIFSVQEDQLLQGNSGTRPGFLTRGT